MKKWLPLFLFLVFAHDVAVDAFEADCAGQEPVCHTCFCQNHFVSKDVHAANEKIPSLAENIAISSVVLSSPNFTRDFFHPPKALA